MARPVLQLCPVVGHDRRPQQVHPHHARVVPVESLPGCQRRRVALPEPEPVEPHFFGQSVHPGRQFCQQPAAQAWREGRGPERQPHREHESPGQPDAHPWQAGGAHGGLERETATPGRGQHRCQRDQPERRALMVLDRVEAGAGTHRQEFHP